ncbi:hypothetical protein L9F63_028097, partial [Diploptera punctata]
KTNEPLGDWGRHVPTPKCSVNKMEYDNGDQMKYQGKTIITIKRKLKNKWQITER